MPAYGFDDEGEREHDCCDVCGSGSCPGSGSGGDDACTYRRPPTPPLSPEERAVVDRFESAPDPFAEDTARVVLATSCAGCLTCQERARQVAYAYLHAVGDLV